MDRIYFMEAVELLKDEIGLVSAYMIGIPATIAANKLNFCVSADADQAEQNKTALKNAFKLVAQIYPRLQKKYGKQVADDIMGKVLVKVATEFFQGFKPIGPDDKFPAFAKIYKDFESHNLVFDVIEETDTKLDVIVRRCLIYEAMKDLGMGDLIPHLCQFAFTYFQSYHPNIKYLKDKMIGSGDACCHETFLWKEEELN
ncbi:MAG: L-2-amino-thiazoline-4-carboxylic acid hydrolase [bacterium]|nr:L-2-amino-thiazoline-4-carboxylic acid hydrolase [bacterium]